MKSEFDILILGGGLVGCSLACALDGTGLRVALVEATLPSTAPPGFDERKLVLAAASLNALASLGILPDPSVVSPVRKIHVSRVGDFGAVRLDARESGREFFGGVISARELGAALERRLQALRNLTVVRPATVSHVGTEAGQVSVQVDEAGQARTLQARLLVGADGTRSTVRAAAGIGADEHDYEQMLFVCSVATDRPADGTAYERFSADGPLALLPMGRDYGAICTVASSRAAHVAALDDAGFATYFQDRFGWRAGRVERAGARSAYPIRRVLAHRLTSARMVLVGNAAQTIHPVGAQGFNLGLRDALTLAETLDINDPGSRDALDTYVAAREEDRRRTLAFSDGLARITSNTTLPMQLARSFGLLALGHVPGLSDPLVGGAMGFRGRVPALARSQR